MSVIDEVKQRIDAVELIGRYVELRKAGATYKGLCPFHNERTPSFIVFPDSGTWHCFGSCGVGGDIFSFLMRRENLEFREVLEMLASEAGVTLEAEHDPAQGQRNRLYDINEAAATYFHEILRHHAGAAPARTYLARRGVKAETIAQFRLGFALDSWSGLRDFLLEKGWSLAEQIEAGLAKHNEERNSSYDAFRGRVMIPICDRQSRVIGFGGRLLGDGQPKYLNTAETPLFHKSRVIFGLDLAREAIRREDKVVIVEGYMDVIAAHQHGFANVVACMGTSLTSEQLQQLHRFTNNFILALDADAAGQQATVRGLNQARQSLLRVQKPTVTATGQVRLTERLNANLSIVSMPTGLDPDDVIRRDPQQWQTLVANAQPLVDFYFRFIAEQYDLTSARGKGLAVAEIAPLIAELDDEIERQHYIQQLSREVQIDELTILSRVQAAAKTSQLPTEPTKRRFTDRPNLNRHRQPTQAATQSPPAPWESSVTPSQRPAETKPPIISPEDGLVANLLYEPNLLVGLVTEMERLEITPLRSEDFQSIQNREIFRAIKHYMAGNEPWDLELFQERLSPHLHGHLANLTAYTAQLPDCSITALQADLLSALIRIRIEQIGAYCKHIKFIEEDAFRHGDVAGAKQYSDIKNKHLRELAHLQISKQRYKWAMQGAILA